MIDDRLEVINRFGLLVKGTRQQFDETLSDTCRPACWSIDRCGNIAATPRGKTDEQN